MAASCGKGERVSDKARKRPTGSELRGAIRRLDRQLGERLDEVWERAGRLVHDLLTADDGQQRGRDHSEAVEEHIAAIVPAEWMKCKGRSCPWARSKKHGALSLFCLSAAAALHDVGRLPGVSRPGEDHGEAGARWIVDHRDSLALRQAEARVVADFTRVHNHARVRELGEHARTIGSHSLDVLLLSSLLTLADALHDYASRVTSVLPGKKILPRGQTMGFTVSGDTIWLDVLPYQTEDVAALRERLNWMNTDHLAQAAAVLKANDLPHHIQHRVDTAVLRDRAQEDADRSRGFLGHDYFGEADAAWFKGRTVETQRLLAQVLLGGRVSLLRGDSGVGKTSLVCAGLIPLLKHSQVPVAYVRADPRDVIGSVIQSAWAQLASPEDSLPGEELLPALERIASDHIGGTAVIVIDQFEDVARLLSAVPPAFAHALSRVHARYLANIHIVLAYRSDAQGQLDRFLQNLRGSGQSLGECTLLPLGPQAAEEALRAGFERARLPVSEEGGRQRTLIDVVLADLLRESEHVSGSGSIYPPYLQMVGLTLARQASREDQHVVTTGLYRKTGGAHRIVADYLLTRLGSLGDLRENAESVLFHLSSASGRGVALSGSEIAAQARLMPQRVDELIGALVGERMVRHIGEGRYEIVHDHFARLIEEQSPRGIEEREFRNLRGLLRQQAAAYPTTKSLLEPQVVWRLYLHRERIGELNPDESRLLLLTSVATLAPVWFWHQSLSIEAWADVCLQAQREGRRSVRESARWALEQTARGARVSVARYLLPRSRGRVREAAISTLGRAGGHEDLPGLHDALRDSYEGARRAAAEAIVHLTRPHDSAAIEGLLAHGSGPVRHTASRVIMELSIEQGWRIAGELLDHADWDIRGGAADALSHICTERDLPTIRPEVGAGHREKEAPAAWSLGEVGLAADLPAMVRLLRHPDERVREASAWAVAKLGTRAYLSSLRTALRDPSKRVRIAALSAVAQLGAAQGARTLRRMLRDPDEDVREAAIRAVTQVGAAADLPVLRRMLRDPNDAVREAAVRAMAEFGTTVDLPALRKMLRDPRYGVRQATARASAALVVRYGPSSCPEWVTQEPSVRDAVLQAFADSGRLRDLPLLHEVFPRDDWGSQQELNGAVERRATRDDIPLLKEWIEGDSETLRRAGAVGLAAVASRRNLPLLHALCGHSDRSVRQAAREGVGRLATRADLLALGSELKKLASADWGHPFVQAVKRLATPEDIPFLRQWLRDSETCASGAAAIALAKLGSEEDAAAIVALLVRPGRRLHPEVIDALLRVGDERALDALARAAVDGREPKEMIRSFLFALDRELYCPSWQFYPTISSNF
jgi:HEAT repeat protein